LGDFRSFPLLSARGLCSHATSVTSKSTVGSLAGDRKWSLIFPSLISYCKWKVPLHAWLCILISLKNPLTSAGFGSMNTGYNGECATTRLLTQTKLPQYYNLPLKKIVQHHLPFWTILLEPHGSKWWWQLPDKLWFWMWCLGLGHDFLATYCLKHLQHFCHRYSQSLIKSDVRLLYEIIHFSISKTFPALDSLLKPIVTTSLLVSELFQ
jgi:hypothetical protein